MEPKLVYQDDSFFVVDKPSGWITNEADTTTSQPVLQTWIKSNFEYPLKESFDMRSGVVHRLDKETSGLLIIAKTKEAFEKLQAQFKERKVKKTYIALLHGKLDPEMGKIEAEVGRLPWRRDRFGVVAGGRPSKSAYKLIKFIKGDRGGYSLTEFKPTTGRTHQIRIHARHIGHAIVGDEFYAGRKTARNDRKWCPRLFLHASSITFTHPKTGKKVSFVSELPADLASSLQTLEAHLN